VARKNILKYISTSLELCANAAYNYKKVRGTVIGMYDDTRGSQAVW